MRDKTYKQLFSLANESIVDIYEHFSVYIHLFEKKAEETKANSYGGYELTKFAGDFNKELNQKCSELLKEIEKLFVGSGRKLSRKQYMDLIEKCTKPFDSIVDNYSEVFEKEFGLNETIKTSLKISKSRMFMKISGFINALNIISNTKIDKALVWTAVGTVFAGISLILSVIAIILTSN